MQALPNTSTASRPVRVAGRRRGHEFGKPHIDYGAHPKRVDWVVKQLRNGVAVSTIQEQSGVPRSTLYYWKSKMARDPGFDPLITGYGQHLRIFTPEEERVISTEIKETFLEAGLLFTDQEFRQLIMERYVEKYKDCDNIPIFNCSAGYISDFKWRNRFRSRKCHLKRRSGIDPTEAAQWTAKIKTLLQENDPNFVLNCDETSWKVFPNNILTWGTAGNEAISVKIQGDVKQCLTVLATVSASGTKLPLLIISEGKTVKCEQSQLGDTAYHWKTHTENGWQTTESFELYLMHLRELMGDTPLHLLLDLHASHRTQRVKTLAKSLDISLHFIPAGMTDILQPCDRRIFGSLKATARRLWRERGRADEKSRGKREAVEDLFCAWEKLSTTTIEEAWEVYYE